METRDWQKSWALGFLLAAVALAAIGGLARSQGYRPRITHDKDTWASQRARLSSGRHEQLALVGQSRILMGFSMEEAKSALPAWDIVQLAYDYSGAAPTFHDLAKDPLFKGVLILDIMPSYTFENPGTQQGLVDHFHHNWSFDRRANRWVRTKLQQRSVLLNPRLNLLWQAYSWVGSSKPLPPDFYVDSEDRDRDADWGSPDARKLIETRLVHPYWAFPHHRESYEAVTNRLVERLEESIPFAQQVRNRGGKVVFLRMPWGSPATPRSPRGNSHEADEPVRQECMRDMKAYETARLTDFGKRTGEIVLAWSDVPGMEGLVTPDASHLDGKDKAAFTRHLLAELTRRGVLSGGAIPMVKAGSVAQPSP